MGFGGFGIRVLGFGGFRIGFRMGSPLSFCIDNRQDPAPIALTRSLLKEVCVLSDLHTFLGSTITGQYCMGFMTLTGSGGSRDTKLLTLDILKL